MLARLICGAILTFAICETALAQSTTTNERSLASEAQFFGTIKSITGKMIVVRLRNGEDVSVDLSPALEAYTAAVPVAGANVEVIGTMNNDTVEASSLLRVKAPETWGSDRLP